MKRLMYLHIAWALCSTFYSISIATSAKQLIGQVVEYYLLYYMLLRIITDVRTVHKIVYAMMMAMAVCCVFGMIEAYTSWSVLTIFPSNLWIVYGGPGPLFVEWGRGLRIRSTFPHPILFGVALAISIPIVFYMLAERVQKTRRYVLWLTLLLMFWAIYKTSSRGPWLTVGISFVLLSFLLHQRVRKYLAVTALLGVVVLAARPGVWDTIANLYQSTQDAASPAGASYEFRHALIQSITDAVGKNPSRAMLGYGLGTFREKGLDINHRGEVRHWYTCDNGWALFLYETGYVGLGLIAILLFRPLLMMLRIYKRVPRPERHFLGVMFISLVGFYFSLLSVAGYNWGQQGFMAWILIALSVAYPRIVIRDLREKAAKKLTVATPTAELQTEAPILQPALTRMV